MNPPPTQPPKPQRQPALLLGIAGVVIVALAGALVFALNRDTPSPQAAAPSGTQSSAPPADGGTYTDPNDIVTATSNILPCSDAKPDPGVSGALAQTTCSDGNIVIRVYSDQTQRDRTIDGIYRLAGASLLIGRNWTINSEDAALLAPVQNVLGGEVRRIPCDPGTCALAP